MIRPAALKHKKQWSQFPRKLFGSQAAILHPGGDVCASVYQPPVHLCLLNASSLSEPLWPLKHPVLQHRLYRSLLIESVI